MNDLVGRRIGELQFVSSAYLEEEAWTDSEESSDCNQSRVYRRLVVARTTSDGESLDGDAIFLLRLDMLKFYPLESAL